MRRRTRYQTAYQAVVSSSVDAVDTIAAIATPNGVGGVGVLRVSGPDVPQIAQVLLGKLPRPRYAEYAAFREDDGIILDRGLALYFPQPHSFTGEHILELHAHGSPVVLQLLLKRVIELGARMARPGEFSERAFLNGKLDLTQAEAIADLIASQSEVAARAALRSMEGEFSKKVHQLSEALVRIRVHIEAALDFSEEEIDFLAMPQLLLDLEAVQTQLAALLVETRRGAMLRDGLHVVIVGRPNTGKSSLLNALTQSDRAIVTPIAGTTRDLLREAVQLGGIALTLVDTAGLREETQDPVEQEGIRRAQLELLHADVVILVTDDQQAQTDRPLLPKHSANATLLIVHNKIDISGMQPRRETQHSEIHLWLSANTGLGLDLLRAELKRLAGHIETGGTFSARTRHVDALENVTVSLVRTNSMLRTKHAAELAAEELRGAQQALNSITGEFSVDDLLGAIFSTFCIGK